MGVSSLVTLEIFGEPDLVSKAVRSKVLVEDVIWGLVVLTPSVSGLLQMGVLSNHHHHTPHFPHPPTHRCYFVRGKPKSCFEARKVDSFEGIASIKNQNQLDSLRGLKQFHTFNKEIRLCLNFNQRHYLTEILFLKD